MKRKVSFVGQYNGRDAGRTIKPRIELLEESTSAVSPVGLPYKCLLIAVRADGQYGGFGFSGLKYPEFDQEVGEFGVDIGIQTSDWESIDNKLHEWLLSIPAYATTFLSQENISCDPQASKKLEQELEAAMHKYKALVAKGLPVDEDYEAALKLVDELDKKL